MPVFSSVELFSLGLMWSDTFLLRLEARLGSLLSLGVMFPTVKDFVLGNFFNLCFLGEDDNPSERFSKELDEAEVLSQFLVVLVEDSKHGN